MCPASQHQIVIDYERWLRSWGASDKTVKARVNLARGRLTAWGLEGVTVEHITEWLGREDLSRWSRATYHSNLKDFCAWLAAAGHLVVSPMEHPSIRKPKRPRSRPRPLSEAEVALVLRVTPPGRTRDWIVLALCTGLRAHEIAKLRGEHVCREGIYVKGKGGVEDTLPCHPDVWEMARRYPHRGWWFPDSTGLDHVSPDGVTMAVGRLFRTLGIDGSVHRLRHVYGTRLLRSGVHIRLVQRLMRHATLETTAGYTAVDEDEQRAAVFLLPSAVVQEAPELPPAA